MLTTMIAAALAAQAQPAAPARAPSRPPAAVRAPRPTPPEVIGGSDPEYSQAERDAGHHGTVHVAGTVGLDGKMRDVRISRSSGAAGLDEAALAAARAASFTPGRDPSGTPAEMAIHVRYDFASYTSDEPGGGLRRYGCAQFVRDMDWWRATFPERPWGDHELYRMIRGLGALGGAGGLDPSRIARDNEDFARRWPLAIEACRRSPQRRLADMLRPEGRLIDRLSEQVR